MRRKNTNQRHEAPICSALGKILILLLLLLPVVPFFSYYPVMKLGADHSMNFELSLPLIWLVIFDAVAFVTLAALGLSKTRFKTSRQNGSFWGPNFPGISDRRIFLLTLFPFWATISILWSDNPLRGILTAGIIWLLWFAIFTIISLLPVVLLLLSAQSKSGSVRNKSASSARKATTVDDPTSRTAAQKLKHILLVIFLTTSVLVSAFCWLQAILDIIGLGRADTLLCAGCTYRSFGFPHPSGFAIEPQFMGNLLLAPALTALFLLVWRGGELTKGKRWLLRICATFLTATLFFTFSRGAIYAFIIALVILLIWALVQKRRQSAKIQNWFALLLIPFIAFGISLGAQGLFAEFGPTSETFDSGIAKSIHQLSLGIVDLRSLAKLPSANSPEQNDRGVVVEGEVVTAEPEEEVFFEGYVAESTDYRLLLNRVAWNLWRSSPQNILFGVGLGAAGTAMHDFSPLEITSAKEIVQNEAFSILLELGLVGIALLIFEFLVIFCPKLFSSKFLDGRAAQGTKGQGSFWSHPALPLLASLIVAYLITLNFFSGLPNALQIYLFPPLLYFIFSNYNTGSQSAKKRS